MTYFTEKNLASVEQTKSWEGIRLLPFTCQAAPKERKKSFLRERPIYIHLLLCCCPLILWGDTRVQTQPQEGWESWRALKNQGNNSHLILRYTVSFTNWERSNVACNDTNIGLNEVRSHSFNCCWKKLFLSGVIWRLRILSQKKLDQFRAKHSGTGQDQVSIKLYTYSGVSSRQNKSGVWWEDRP